MSGALTAALLLLPSAIGYGLILAGPLASDQVGIAVALLASIVGGLVVGLLGGAGPLMAGASLPVTLLMTGALSSLPPDPERALAQMVVIVVLVGLLLAGIAVTGLGTVLARVPYPVLAGILNGTAILMLMGMLPFVLPVSSLFDGSGVRWGGVPVAALVVGLLLFARMPRRLAVVPMVLVAIVAGTVLHHLLVALAGPDVAGPVLRTLPGPATVWTDWRLAANGLARTDWAAALPLALPTAASIAFLVVIETMTAASALHDATGHAAPPRRLLLATAAASLASGLAGGLPPPGAVSGTLGCVAAGGMTRLAPLLRSAFLVGFTALLALLPFQLPMAALAGVLIAGGLRLVDLDGLRLIWGALRRGRRHRGELAGSAVVIVAVTAVAVGWSLTAAVVAGLVLSLGVFAVAMARDVVRRTYPSPPGRSRTSRGAAETGTLLAERGRIAVMEIEGAVFFGSVEEIATHVAAASAGGAEFVVLDMRRVTRLDLSGARQLVRMCQRLRAGGLQLLLASVRPGLPVWDYLDQLALLRQVDPAAVFPSLDAALQAAENALLARCGATAERASPPAALAQLGMGEDAAAVLLPRMEGVTLAPGERVITAGDVAGELYLLLDGQLDVVLPRTGPAPETRLATVAAGALFGEMALVSGGVRSADVVARTEAACLRLGAAEMGALKRERPDVALDLVAAIARQMDRNLRLANMTIRSLEE